MKKHIQNSQKPSIVIGETDHQRLNKLALAAADRLPEVSDGLLIALERALVVADTSVPRNVVQMESTVEYEADTGDGRTVTLVFPKDADISEGRISVLTPSELPYSACPPVRQWVGADGMIGGTS